jgi:hypothetical protein
VESGGGAVVGNTFKWKSLTVFLLIALGIAAMIFLPGDFFYPQTGTKEGQSRIVIPRVREGSREDGRGGPGPEGRPQNPLIPLAQGETAAAMLTLNFDDDPQDEQVLVCRNFLKPETPLYVIYADFDPLDRGYRRVWTTRTVATRPGTVTLSTLDIIGDGGICVLLRGLSNGEEETLTILRKNPPSTGLEAVPPFNKIAELRIEGSISLKEPEQLKNQPRGGPRGTPMTIAAYGRNYESSNPLDRVELVYTYNPVNGLYEQSRFINIPGVQIEQRRIQELLSGGTGKFEQFMDGLWYFFKSPGVPDLGQYIYFDTLNREIVFYGDETEQVFTWERSNNTRYGVYISTQNLSVTTLKRFIDVELDSLNSLRVRVIEDVSLKIGVSTTWDGYYRKAGTFERGGEAPVPPIAAHIEASYDGTAGKFFFYKDGSYELFRGRERQQGVYVFFRIDGGTFLEFRPSPESREIYRVRPGGPQADAGAVSLGPESAPESPYPTLTLDRIRLSVRGIQELHNLPIVLSLVLPQNEGI